MLQRLGRYVIIGDVHGCCRELDLLLTELHLQSTDRITFVGDLIDKGPDSLGVIRRVQKLAEQYFVDVVQGNHEEKFLRYLDKIDQAPDYIQDLAGQLTEKDIEFLTDTQITRHIGEWGVAVIHGGVLPAHDLLPDFTDGEIELTSKQRKLLGRILRTRYVRGVDEVRHEVRLYDASGKLQQKIKQAKDDPIPKAPLGGEVRVKEYVKEKGDFICWGEETPTDIFWADIYDGRFGHLYFGHESFMQVAPKEFPHATGLDLGCVAGGRLAAVVLDQDGGRQFVSVPALDKYCELADLHG